ncbi:MAG: EamA family transporter RarD [Acidobacteria bacterium]|nr:EamA family transporter RarD [Acidobacteriota bacterium]
MHGDSDRRNGLWATAAAFAFWGLTPIYWKAVAAVSAGELLALRVLWAVPLAAALVTLLHGWGGVRSAFTSRRILPALLLTAALIGGNWLVFLIAVENGQILQSSLGYFINPLLSILLGFLFLGERLRAVQWVAVALAAAGVANQIVAVGELPWIALFLAGTFGLYGLIRKTIAVSALPGFFIEVALIAPLALFYMAWAISGSASTLVVADGGTQWLIPVAGVITVTPLVLFSYGARRIPLATVGLLQFLTPSAHLLLATRLYGEPFTASHVATFVLIWSALALYLGDLFRRERTA